MTEKYFGFRTPFTCLIAGPSKVGKTTFLFKVLENHEKYIDVYKNLNILYCYGIESESTGKQLDNTNAIINWKKGLPNEKDIQGVNTIIIDDLLVEASKDESVTNLFTRVSHHKRINVFILIQNIFYKSPVIRNINLNSTYIVLFKNPRDKSQVMVFAKQFIPQNVKFFMDSYTSATSKPYGYLLVDLHPETDDRYRIRSDIFRNDIKGNIVQSIYTEN